MLGQIIVPLGTAEYPPRRRFPVVTATIVALNVAVFFYELSILLTGARMPWMYSSNRMARCRQR